MNTENEIVTTVSAFLNILLEHIFSQIAVESVKSRSRRKLESSVGLYVESHALVIGVSNYTNGWPKLPGVIGDVSAVRDALETHGFNVQVMYKKLRVMLSKEKVI